MQIKMLLLTTMAAVILGSISQQAVARIKCWTNNEGVRECGESVPPEFAQKGHQELSKQGLVLEKQERAKTEEELAEEARLAAIEEEKQRIAEEQAKEDRILLQTYAKVEDIEHARDEQLDAIEVNVKVSMTRNEKIQDDLDKRIAQAAAQERAGKTPNEDLLKDIESLRRQLNSNNEFVKDKKVEQEAIKKDYAQKISRFKELRGLE